MKLTFEQFKQLRNRGVSVDQIKKFASGEQPQVGERFREETGREMPTFSPMEGPPSIPTMTRDVRERGKEAITQAFKYAPEALQFGGGVVGGVTMGPYRGSALGGTAGRAAGIPLREESKESPERAFMRPIVTAGMGSQMAEKVLGPQQYDPEQTKRIAKELGLTALLEAATAGLAKGVVGGGRGVMKGLLGRRVAERGINYGWKNLLNPKFFR